MSVTVPAGVTRPVAAGARRVRETREIEMAKMHDGSERIPDGTYVQVRERLAAGSLREARHYVGKVVGTDMFGSKYEIGARYGGWGEWLFLDGGSWAFIGEVTAISEAEALAVPAESDS